MSHIRILLVIAFSLYIIPQAMAQGDNEIQVYAAPTIQHKWTIFELHSNYTFKGSKLLSEPHLANWTNETLEITHGFGRNFEIGFYTFTGIDPNGKFQYLGNQLRPRVTVPQSWNWGFGASISLEFGFFRPDNKSEYYWQGELRPIIDKTFGKWYFSFNPNLDFVLSGENKGIGLSPQFKTVFTIQQKFGFGFEYYGSLGNFDNFLPGNLQEHLIGPMIDLYLHPKWEINGGFLFGLTENSNQQILKLLLGRRVGK